MSNRNRLSPRPVSLAAMLSILDRDALALVATAPQEAFRLALLASLLRQGVRL